MTLQILSCTEYTQLDESIPSVATPNNKLNTGIGQIPISSLRSVYSNHNIGKIGMIMSVCEAALNYNICMWLKWPPLVLCHPVFFYGRTLSIHYLFFVLRVLLLFMDNLYTTTLVQRVGFLPV